VAGRTRFHENWESPLLGDITLKFAHISVFLFNKQLDNLVTCWMRWQPILGKINRCISILLSITVICEPLRHKQCDDSNVSLSSL